MDLDTTITKTKILIIIRDMKAMTKEMDLIMRTSTKTLEHLEVEEAQAEEERLLILTMGS